MNGRMMSDQNVVFYVKPIEGNFESIIHLLTGFPPKVHFGGNSVNRCFFLPDSDLFYIIVISKGRLSFGTFDLD